MSATPAFLSTPVLGVATINTAQTTRATGTSSNVVDVTTAAPAAGTRIVEVRVKATDNPADSVVVLWLHNGSTNYAYAEIDIGDPAAVSATVAGYETTVTYQNLILPSGWKLQASITATTTAGYVNVFAHGGDLT